MHLVCRKWLAHPGELTAAEAFAVVVQREAVQQLPVDMRERVIVAATSHTDETAFLYNQPTITTLPGALTKPCQSASAVSQPALSVSQPRQSASQR